MQTATSPKSRLTATCDICRVSSQDCAYFCERCDFDIFGSCLANEDNIDGLDASDELEAKMKKCSVHSPIEHLRSFSAGQTPIPQTQFSPSPRRLKILRGLSDTLNWKGLKRNDIVTLNVDLARNTYFSKSSEHVVIYYNLFNSAGESFHGEDNHQHD